MVRTTNGKPYLGYFKEFGEEFFTYCHAEATNEEITKALLGMLDTKFKLKAAEAEFLDNEETTALITFKNVTEWKK